MKLVTKEQFLQMFDLGILIGNDKKAKTWTTCSHKKSAKRKNRYVDDDSYAEYLKCLKRKGREQK